MCQICLQTPCLPGCPYYREPPGWDHLSDCAHCGAAYAENAENAENADHSASAAALCPDCRAQAELAFEEEFWRLSERLAAEFRPWLRRQLEQGALTALMRQFLT